MLYKCIKYQLSIQWNITKIKEPEKASSTLESWGQEVADPTRSTLWAFQDFHGSHLKQGSGIKMTKMRFIDGFNWKAALLLWETQKQPPGFPLPNSCFDFSWKKDRAGIIPKVLNWMWWDTKSSSHLRNMEKSWKGFKAVVANLQSFSPLDSFILGVECSTWSQLRVTQNNPIFLCVQLQQSMELALLNSSHGARATQTPKPGFVPVSRA